MLLKINDVELEFDMFDLDTAEKYEQALDRVLETAKPEEGIRMSESIRKQCHSVFNFFDEVFGEGTHEKIFGGKTNLVKCLEAFEEVVKATESQKQVVEKITNKYSPNRAQKRAKK